MKKALLLLMVAAPFLFIGWYMIAGLAMALMIRATIPDMMYNGDRKTAAVLWCLLVAAVLAFGGDASWLCGWIVTFAGMLVVAWPRDKGSNMEHMSENQDEYGNIYTDGRTIITDADVIDV